MGWSKNTPLLLPLLALPYLAGCATVLETGRTQLLIYSEPELVTMGAQAYAEATEDYSLILGTEQAAMVQTVGEKIAAASGREYEWEFKLLDAPDVVNAFALPGGKIAVYSGLFKVAPDADSLATVVGHEVAHVTAQHGNERMSQSNLAALGLGAGQILLNTWDDPSANTKNLVMGLLGLTVDVVALKPYSRLHESEADEIGLRFLVRAGYDPQAAPALWERMAELNPSGSFALFATHPDPLDRAKRLRQLIPTVVAEETRK